jgi:hypothetical protein
VELIFRVCDLAATTVFVPCQFTPQELKFASHQEQAARLHQPAFPGKVVQNDAVLHGQQTGCWRPLLMRGFCISDPGNAWSGSPKNRAIYPNCCARHAAKAAKQEILMSKLCASLPRFKVGDFARSINSNLQVLNHRLVEIVVEVQS